jgi:EAL domain-containing protein (putative c-di-GMP-specific phosphodiesterase class I)
MGACDKEDQNVIIRSIIPLAENLGLDVVAEGVENNDQMAFLKQLQCKYAQGFLFSRAVDAEAATKLLLDPDYIVDPVAVVDVVLQSG